MSSAAPRTASTDTRPPVPPEPAPGLGAAEPPYQPLRRTAQSRPVIMPGIWDDPLNTLGYSITHPYVRRFWTSVLGPGAVTDLLRLATAARRGRSLARPVYLTSLIREGLVASHDGKILVRVTIPPLGAHHIRRLPPALRREHEQLRWDHPHRPR